MISRDKRSAIMRSQRCPGLSQWKANMLRQVTHYGPLPALQDSETLPLIAGFSYRASDP